MWCTECHRRPAVTRDGRSLCRACLRSAIRRDVPMADCCRGRARTRDHRQAFERDPSPWQENAIRHLEDPEP